MSGKYVRVLLSLQRKSKTTQDPTDFYCIDWDICQTEDSHISLKWHQGEEMTQLSFLLEISLETSRSNVHCHTVVMRCCSVKVLFHQSGYRRAVGVWLCHLEPTKWVVSERWNAGVCWAFSLTRCFPPNEVQPELHTFPSVGNRLPAWGGGALKCLFVVRLNISLSPQMLHDINEDRKWLRRAVAKRWFVIYKALCIFLRLSILSSS